MEWDRIRDQKKKEEREKEAEVEEIRKGSEEWEKYKEERSKRRR